MAKINLWWYLNLKKVKTKMYPMVKNSLRYLWMRYLVVFQDIFSTDFSVLIKPTQPINLGTAKSPKIIHVAQSLSTKEKENFAKFFQDKKINFA